MFESKLLRLSPVGLVGDICEKVHQLLVQDGHCQIEDAHHQDEEDAQHCAHLHAGKSSRDSCIQVGREGTGEMVGCCTVESKTSQTAVGPRRQQCLKGSCQDRSQTCLLHASSQDAEAQPVRSQLTCSKLFSGHTYVIEVPSRLTQLR